MAIAVARQTRTSPGRELNDDPTSTARPDLSGFLIREDAADRRHRDPRSRAYGLEDPGP